MAGCTASYENGIVMEYAKADFLESKQLSMCMKDLIEHKYHKIWQSFSFEMVVIFGQMANDAEQTCLEHLERSAYNYEEFIALWESFKEQIAEQIDQIEERWAKNEFANALRTFMLWEEEDNKVNLHKQKQYRLLDNFQLQLEGKLAEKVYQHVQSVFVKDFRCDLCKEQIAVEKDVLTKHQLTCPRCNTKMQYDPGEEIDNISEILTEKMLLMKCIVEHNQKDQAFQKILDGIVRKITNQTHWEEFKVAYHNYYKKYFACRKKLCSNTKQAESIWKHRLEDYVEFEGLYRGS